MCQEAAVEAMCDCSYILDVFTNLRISLVDDIV